MNLVRLLILLLVCSTSYNEVAAQYSLHNDFKVEDANSLKLERMWSPNLVYDLRKQTASAKLYNGLGITFTVISVVSLTSGIAILSETKNNHSLTGEVLGEIYGKTLIGVGLLNASLATVSFVIYKKRKKDLIEL